MSTSTTHQQSLVDAGSETRPPMLEKGSYVPWASQFRRYIEDDLRGDELLYYEAKIEVMNLILISIPNDIYNSVDACTTAKAMWKRVEREELVSVYNRFTQLMNDLERNEMNFPLVTINTKFLNCLQLEWLKYVTQVRLAKRLTEDTFDDLFDYLQQFEKLVKASRAKKLEKSHAPLDLIAHTGSSSKNASSYYVTHPPSVVDYDDEYQKDVVQTNFEDPLASEMLMRLEMFKGLFELRLQEILQMFNATTDEAGGILTDAQNDFLFDDASRMEEFEELSANICLMARIQPANTTSDAGLSYDSAFVSEVQSSSIKDNQEQMYPTHTKLINSTIGDDQIDSNIIFDEPNRNVNSGSVEDDTHVSNLYALEQLAKNAYREEKQQLFAQKVQQQNTTLTSQLELYKERVRVLENIKGDKNYPNEYIEADQKAKRFDQQAQSQFVHDRDIIRDLEQQRDKLDLVVIDYKRKNEELQKTQSILKRQMSEKEDSYHDNILDLEAKHKKNVDLMMKLGNSLQGIFMLGQKPLPMYDSRLKHGLGYPNPYTLKQAISECPKLYLASSLSNSEIPLDVRDTEDILDDASKSQNKMKEKMNDPIAVAKKQNCWSIDYKQINDLYDDFVPQKELSAEQKYFSSSFISSDKTSNATSSILASMPKSKLCELKKRNEFLKDQLLEATLKHEVEISVLLSHECVDNSLHAEIEQIQRNSIEIQEGMQARIKVLEKDVQSCQKQSVGFELKLQHEKEKRKWESSLKNDNANSLGRQSLDYSWISKMEKLDNENVSLDFKAQSLIKERDNVKLEYQKLFDSIKKTRSQTQKEIDELIDHVFEKTYGYGVIRAENQNLLNIISELKTRLRNVEKCKFVNTKFDKTNVSQNLLCVTSINKQVFHKKNVVSKTEEKRVVSKPVTLQTSSNKQRGANSNKNVIAPGMYKIVTKQESQTKETKSGLSSTGMNVASSVRRPMN
ncbi:hypothetical protein Tco_0754226 [Tanacetum coccineum]